jgi:hypothetical protein
MIKGAFIDYKIRRPQLRDDGPLINTNALFQASIVKRNLRYVVYGPVDKTMLI